MIYHAKVLKLRKFLPYPENGGYQFPIPKMGDIAPLPINTRSQAYISCMLKMAFK
jgi:hypothetical protein